MRLVVLGDGPVRTLGTGLVIARDGVNMLMTSVMMGRWPLDPDNAHLNVVWQSQCHSSFDNNLKVVSRIKVIFGVHWTQFLGKLFNLLVGTRGSHSSDTETSFPVEELYYLAKELFIV